MDYHYLNSLRRSHPAWRLLAAKHAPLVISFLHQAFIEPNLRTLSEAELIARLEDTLYAINAGVETPLYPKSAVEYLKDWADDDKGWLRRFYPKESDEPHFDLTAVVEAAMEWLKSLQQSHFVGTESRLRTIFQLLQQMVQGAETDPGVRIRELESQKQQLDQEITDIRDGRIELISPVALKERYLQVDQTARALLSDFRQLEQNFRDLDRDVREQITTWEGSKGELLEQIFGDRDVISDSDQGKSFHAFWDFLMSPAKQEELSELLQQVIEMEAVQSLNPDHRLLRIHYDWLEAGETAQRTVAGVSSQLRKYLDDQAWLENRRIMDIIRGIEQKALAVRNQPPPDHFMELDQMRPAITPVMDRPLFTPPVRPVIEQQVLLEGRDNSDPGVLFDQIYVDRERLQKHIQRGLQNQDQISLSELVQSQPLEQGLAELVTYLELAADDPRAVIDEQQRFEISWRDSEGKTKLAKTPRVIYSR